MEGHRSEVRDGRESDSVEATAASVPYRSPRLKVTGTAVAVIRGSHPSGMTDKFSDFYWSGE